MMEQKMVASGRKLLPLRVGYVPTPELESIVPLLRAACSHCGAELVRWDAGPGSGLCGVIGAGPGREGTFGRMPHFSFHWISVEAGSSVVEFCKTEAVPGCYQGAVFNVPYVALNRDPGSQAEHAVLATFGGFPTWTTNGENGSRSDECWVPPDAFAIRRNVADVAAEDNFCWLLPLLEWLRDVTEWGAWTHPPVRASIMFDDPNLHSSKYGFVDFAQLASEGGKHRYHSCFATVPFDHFYIADRAVRVFRENQAYLSLLVHGNNHTHRELAQRRSRSGHRAEARQAWERISSLEQRSGLSVAKVMAPPHGACSAAMMEAMAMEGYEAACISHGSVIATNLAEPWTALMGLQQCTVMHGLPIIPRFGLTSDVSFAATRAAYLGQAIVPVGHHWDLGDGVALLRQVAQQINALGSVHWSNMTDIARTNFRTRVLGDHMFIVSYANRFSVTVPDGVTAVSVELFGVDWTQAAIECSETATGRKLARHDGEPWVFSCLGARAIDVRIQPVAVSGEDVERIHTPVRAGTRRVAVEIRDRIMPLLPRSLQRR